MTRDDIDIVKLWYGERVKLDRDKIISLALWAGFLLKDEAQDNLGFTGTAEDFEQFAALVAAAEREACAKVAEAYEPKCDICPSGVSAAIRARGEP